jgi:hypothetical protein
MTTSQKGNQNQGYTLVGIFNDKRISFDAFSRSVTSTVPVEVKLAELQTRTRALWAVGVRGDEMTAQMPVLIYRHEGKVVVLSNWPKVEAFLAENENLPEGKSPGVLRARLVSKQLLKHIETVSVPAEVQNMKAAGVERDIQASQEAEWNREDRPRYGDRPQRPYQQREDFGNRQQPARPPQRRPG